MKNKIKAFGNRINKFFGRIFAVTILCPALKIRAGITFKECEIIAKYYLIATSQHKSLPYALKVFRLLFFKVTWRNFVPDFSLFKLDNETEKNAWEIGKWYAISPETLQGTEEQKDTDKLKFFSIGREAISHILKTNRSPKKTALLPNFTCFTVLDPFEQERWDMNFYRYNKDLTVNDEYFLNVFNKIKPSVCAFQALSGMGFTEKENRLIDYARQNGCMTVVDQTQDIYNSRNNPSVDYYCGSLRKWYPFPDGAFLYSEKLPIYGCDDLKENSIYRTSMGLCMFARYLDSVYDDPFFDYLFRFMWDFSVSYIGGTEIATHTMSDYSRKVLMQQNETVNSERRIKNFRYIYQGIKGLKTVKPAFASIERLQSVPLSFPIYVKNRRSFSTFLRSKGIATQLLWSKPPYIKANTETDETTEFIYNHILSLPCDQRYDLDDMEKMVGIICDYERKLNLSKNA